MKRLLILATGAALAAGGLGCQNMLGYGQPHAEAGYSFSYTKPPTVIGPPPLTPVMTGQTSGLVGLDHQTGLSMLQVQPAPVESSALLQGTVSSSRVRPSAAAPVGPAMAAPNPCTLQDVCERIERLERQRAAPPVQRMPPGE
jgi:hypothetical protein